MKQNKNRTETYGKETKVDVLRNGKFVTVGGEKDKTPAKQSKDKKSK